MPAKRFLFLSLTAALACAAPAAAQDFAIPQISQTHRLSIHQTGRDNQARVVSAGPNHDTRISQDGQRNRATQIALGQGARQSIAQHGDDNIGVQASAGLGNVAILTQGTTAAPGHGNIAIQAQAGSGNYARIAQNGNRNLAAQAQIGGVSLMRGLSIAGDLATGLSRGDVQHLARDLSDQTPGAGNRAELTQDGDDNLAVMLQAGNGNSLDVHQMGGAANVYMQIGDGLSKSVAVHQSAGANGVTPVMIIQSR